MVDQLLREGKELEWLEFKKGDATENQRLGKYISGLANAANFCNVSSAFLIFGIENDTLNVVGTNFKYRDRKEKGGELDFYIRRNLQPSINFQHFVCDYHGKVLEIFKIPAAHHVPVSFENEAWIRIASNLVELRKYPDHLRHILNSHRDWSAEIIEKPHFVILMNMLYKKLGRSIKRKTKTNPFVMI